jgi:hypothetical protein
VALEEAVSSGILRLEFQKMKERIEDNVRVKIFAHDSEFHRA